ncbi:active regulator of SIRT1 isoform X1 [Electrophorus electricus]|uniref:Active regulator of SIRT1 n=1 Tax=Electrophorus electricus TaxID=8005 RepID=A0A4W4EET5_ELEEL|nr:active regulator of SIRT1 isoform X1 [Electrophorus electricus]
MSISVIRRGLELLSNDIKDGGKSQKKSCQKTTLMDQISSNKQGVRKQIRQLQAHSQARKSKVTVKNKNVKNALEEYRKKQKKSQLSANLEYFLGTSYVTQEHHTKKIQQQNTGRLSRHQPEQPVRKPAQEKSIFTEEEFQKFQKEYFANL